MTRVGKRNSRFQAETRAPNLLAVTVCVHVSQRYHVDSNEETVTLGVTCMTVLYRVMTSI
jgi:hypothetical protein